MAHNQLPPHIGVSFAEPLHTQPQLDPTAQTLPSPFVVVITGASRGLGRATAQMFSKAGVTGLVLTARSGDTLEETKKLCLESAKAPGLKVSTLGVDAGSEDAGEKIAKVVKDEHGRLDVLINNAGIVSTDETGWGKLGDMNVSQIQTPMQTNYYGRFYTIKHLLPILLESPSSAKIIINVTSICSQFTAFGPAGFNISELASNRLTEIFAESYRDQGVVFYSVHPGTIMTTAPQGLPAESKARLVDMAVDSPELCGSMYLWLIKKRPEWLSGRYISSEWDHDALEKKRDEIVQGDKLKARMVV